MKNLGSLVNNYFLPKLLVTYGSVEGSNLADVETNVLEELYMYEVVISLSLV